MERAKLFIPSQNGNRIKHGWEEGSDNDGRIKLFLFYYYQEYLKSIEIQNGEEVASHRDIWRGFVEVVMNLNALN